MEFSTCARICSRLAVMPRTQRSASTRQPLRKWVMLLNRLWAMIGSKALCCNWPASAAKAHRQVIANHFKSNLVDHFRDHRVDLAGMMLEPA